MAKRVQLEKYYKEIKSKDGSTLTLRPLLPKDTNSEFEMFSTFSDKSSYYRFFGIKRVSSPKDVEEFTHIDYEKNFAIAAFLDEKTQIGVGRICGDGNEAEMAIIVGDKWQRKGIGTGIMELLVRAARDMGYTRLVGEVMSDNVGMIEFVKRLGFEVHIMAGGQYYKIELPLV